MTTSWNDHLFDDLTSWDELELYLTGCWREVRDRRRGLVLTTQYDDLLLDEPPDGTAKQRRLLHRRGFRRRDDRWSWTPPEPVAGQQPPPTPLTGRLAAAWTSVERVRALDRARGAQALHVLREVYGSTPADLQVWVESDDEQEWDDDEEEWEDGGPLLGLDCAALEALLGPVRRSAR